MSSGDEGESLSLRELTDALWETAAELVEVMEDRGRAAEERLTMAVAVYLSFRGRCIRDLHPHEFWETAKELERLS